MTLTTRCSDWVLAQSKLAQYFTLALVFHVVLVLSLASIRLVAQIMKPPINIEPPSFLPLDNPLASITGTGENGEDGQLGQLGGDPFGEKNKPVAAMNMTSLEKAVPRAPETYHLKSPVGEFRPFGDGNFTSFTPGAPFDDFARTGPIDGTRHPFGDRPGLKPGKPGRPGDPTIGDGAPVDVAREKAVLAGLRWLRDNQEPNGSWKCGQSSQAGSALAVLAFLGHGELTESAEFGDTVRKGLNYLVESVDTNGLVAGRNMYAQGAVALALAEGYAMIGSEELRAPLERTINAIVRIQRVVKSNPRHTGGWRYTPASKDSDTSVSGWMIMALKTAKIAGIAVPDDSMESSSKYLWQMYGDHGFGYIEPKKAPNTTAIGVLCLQFLGHGDDPRIKDALNYLRQQKISWDKSTGGFVLYGWYYATFAMQQAGGEYWNQWFPVMRQTLLANQASDGHWPPPPQSSTEIKTLAATPAYSTALATLTLEASYRYKRTAATAIVRSR